MSSRTDQCNDFDKTKLIQGKEVKAGVYAGFTAEWDIWDKILIQFTHFTHGFFEEFPVNRSHLC